MPTPDQMDMFDLLYVLAAANGRDEALLGGRREQLRSLYERTLIGNARPSLYLEFPLLGEPCYDFLSVIDKVEQGATFAPGAGYGYQKAFDWFSTVCEDKNVSMGFELDLSTGKQERAGIYLQQRHRSELVEPFLASVDEARRYPAYRNVQEAMPEGWPPAYVALFPGRKGSPTRIGGYMTHDEQRRCAENPAHIGDCLHRIGFDFFDEQMLAHCAHLMDMAPSIDVQFDIMEDGTLGDTFGLALSFNELRPRTVHEQMESGVGHHIMSTLQQWGLADDRWRLLSDVSFARQFPYVREDGTTGCLGLCTLLNFVKVKFRHAQMQPAKFYLLLAALEL